MQLTNLVLDQPLMVPALDISGKHYKEGSWDILKESEIARIKVTKNSKGLEAIPAFTNAAYLQLWMPQGSFYQALHGEDWFGICIINRLHGIVVNATSEIEFEISLNDIQVALDRN